MMKKTYTAPVAELTVFLPNEAIASNTTPWWMWTWGDAPAASAPGTEITLIDENKSPWDYTGADKPY